MVFSGAEEASGDNGHRGDITGGIHNCSDQLQAQILREVIQGLHKAKLKWGLERKTRMRPHEDLMEC